MTDWIYCGTQPPVNSVGTSELLWRLSAIWTPPANMNGMQPAAGERLWLAWRKRGSPGPRLLLGGGRVRISPSGNLSWTEADFRGIRDLARELGYGGPTNMR